MSVDAHLFSSANVSALEERISVFFPVAVAERVVGEKLVKCLAEVRDVIRLQHDSSELTWSALATGWQSVISHGKIP